MATTETVNANKLEKIISAYEEVKMRFKFYSALIERLAFYSFNKDEYVQRATEISNHIGENLFMLDDIAINYYNMFKSEPTIAKRIEIYYDLTNKIKLLSDNLKDLDTSDFNALREVLTETKRKINYLVESIGLLLFAR